MKCSLAVLTSILLLMAIHLPAQNRWHICAPEVAASVTSEPVPLNLWEVNAWMQEEKMTGTPEGLFAWDIRVLVSESGRVIRSRILTEGVAQIPQRLQAGLDSLRFIPANDHGAPASFWLNLELALTLGSGSAQLSLPQVSLPTNLEAVYQTLARTISQPAVVCHLGVSFRGKVTKVLLSGPNSDDEKERLTQLIQELSFRPRNLGRGLHMTIFKQYPDFREEQQRLPLEIYDPAQAEDPGYHGAFSDLSSFAHALNHSDLMGCVALPGDRFDSDRSETVSFQLQISAAGQLLRIVGTYGDPELWEALLPCIRKLRFAPAYRAGQPVDSWLAYSVDLCAP